MNRILLLALALLGLTVHANAQVSKKAPPTYEQVQACLASLGKPDTKYYTPTVKVDSVKRLPNKRDSIAVLLDEDVCVDMDTFTGRRVVALEGGVASLRYAVQTDGTRVVYAHNGCGNNVYHVYRRQHEPAPVAAPAPPPPVVAPVVAGIAPPRESDLYVHFDTLPVRVSGQIDVVDKGSSTLKIAGIATGVAVLMDAIRCAIWCHRNTPAPAPATKAPVVVTVGDTVKTGPIVTTTGDTVKTTDGRCVTTMPSCPQGMRRPISLIIDPKHKQYGAIFAMPAATALAVIKKII